MIACSIANQAMMVWAIRRDVDCRALIVFLAGGAAGLPLGIWTLLRADHGLYTHALGALLVAYGGYMLVSKPRSCRWQGAALDLGAGFLGGITGGAAAFPSAPVTICCGLKGWDKSRQRAVFQPYILLMQLAALSATALATRRYGSGAGLQPGDLLCVPAGLFGTSVGLACFKRLSNRQFSLAVNVLLIVSGVAYIA